jgi:ABC-type antimicrobial peptide transport system permease subunit
MKTSVIISISIIFLMVSACGTANNFTQKKFLKLDKLVDDKDEHRTSTGAEILDDRGMETSTTQLNGSAFSDEKSDKILDVDQEEIIETTDETEVEKVPQEQDNREDETLTYNAFPSASSTNGQSVKKLEKTTLKTKTSSDKPNNRDRELAWWVVLLLFLGVLIVLPILLIGLIVVYLFFFPAW